MDEKTLEAVRAGKICPIEISIDLSECGFAAPAQAGNTREGGGTDAGDSDRHTDGA